jgi:hypothetical protein
MGSILTRNEGLDRVVDAFFEVDPAKIARIEAFLRNSESYGKIRQEMRSNFLQKGLISYVLSETKGVNILDFRNKRSKNFFAQINAIGVGQVGKHDGTGIGGYLLIFEIDDLPVIVECSLKTKEIEKGTKQKVLGKGVFQKLSRQHVDNVVPVYQELLGCNEIGYLVVLNPDLVVDLRRTHMLSAQERALLIPEDLPWSKNYVAQPLPIELRTELQRTYWQMGGAIVPFPTKSE